MAPVCVLPCFLCPRLLCATFFYVPTSSAISFVKNVLVCRNKRKSNMVLIRSIISYCEPFESIKDWVKHPEGCLRLGRGKSWNAAGEVFASSVRRKSVRTLGNPEACPSPHSSCFSFCCELSATTSEYFRVYKRLMCLSEARLVMSLCLVLEPRLPHVRLALAPRQPHTTVSLHLCM